MAYGGESTMDVQSLWTRLEAEEKQLKQEKRRLQEIWGKITSMHAENESDRAGLGRLRFADDDTRVRLNVGGQEFITTAAVLKRDRFSVLAYLCQEPAKNKLVSSQDPQYAFFIERDWWIFRYILQFLRTDSLPDDQVLLQELYSEASFYRLGLLKRAIEARNQALASGNLPPHTEGSYDGMMRYGANGGGMMRQQPWATAQSQQRTGGYAPNRGQLADPWGFTR